MQRMKRTQELPRVGISRLFYLRIGNGTANEREISPQERERKNLLS